MGVSVRLTAGVAVLLLRCSTPGAGSSRVARVVGIRVQLSEAGRRRSASQWRYISAIIAQSCLNADRAETACRQCGLTGSAGNLKLLSRIEIDILFVCFFVVFVSWLVN